MKPEDSIKNVTSRMFGPVEERRKMANNENCIFCKIVNGDIPSAKLFENNRVIAFADLNPAAPFHALVIPRRHIATLDDLEEKDAPLFGEMTLVAQKLARQAGLAESGYRLIANCNADAGQIVFHIHLHVLGGRPLGGLLPDLEKNT